MVFRERVRCTLESVGWVAKYQCLLGEGFLKADTVQQQPEPLSRLVLGDTTAGGSQAFRGSHGHVPSNTDTLNSNPEVPTIMFIAAESDLTHGYNS